MASSILIKLPRWTPTSMCRTSWVNRRRTSTSRRPSSRIHAVSVIMWSKPASKDTPNISPNKNWKPSKKKSTRAENWRFTNKFKPKKSCRRGWRHRTSRRGCSAKSMTNEDTIRLSRWKKRLKAAATYSVQLRAIKSGTKDNWKNKRESFSRPHNTRRTWMNLWKAKMKES